MGEGLFNMETKTMIEDDRTYKWEYTYHLKTEFKNWNPNRYRWETGSWKLAMYCSKYFEIWWDPNRFYWNKDYYHLLRYCSRYFEIWWDPNKFNWKEDYTRLELYCYGYKDIWEKDYLIWKLTNE